jgi:hypothetical protein
VIDAFGIASIAESSDNYIHDVRLVMIDGHGIVREVDQTAGWDPDDVVASARDLAGMTSNPLRRFWFATIANVSAFCGGSQSVGIAVLLVLAMLLVSAFAIPLVIWVGRHIFTAE